MKNTAFLHRLHKEGKLNLIEPSNEIAHSYLQKSSKSLISAKTLLGIGNLEDSISLSYYSMYHSLTALLFKTGIKCENHTGAIILLKEVFNINNESLSKAKSERIDKQYYVDFSVSAEEAKQGIKTAEEFIAKLNEFMDKINMQDIENYRHNAENLFKENNLINKTPKTA